MFVLFIHTIYSYYLLLCNWYTNSREEHWRTIFREECSGEEHDARIFPDPVCEIFTANRTVQQIVTSWLRICTLCCTCEYIYSTYEINWKLKITVVLSERVRVRSTDLNPAECKILPLRHPDWLLFLVSCLIFIKSW